MKKVSSLSTDKLILFFVLRMVISTVLSILLFSLFFSTLTYKLDLELHINDVFSVIICFLCAAIVAFFSVKSFKNHGVLIGIISEFFLILYSFFNLIFNSNTIILFAIKVIIIVLTGALFGFIKSKNNAKIKVR